MIYTSKIFIIIIIVIIIIIIIIVVVVVKQQLLSVLFLHSNVLYINMTLNLRRYDYMYGHTNT